MLLQLDVGNTRLKWRCLADPSRVVIASGFFVRQDHPDVESLVASLFQELGAQVGVAQLAVIEVGSVAGAAFNVELALLLSDQSGVNPSFSVVSMVASGVKCAYEKPEQLGVDRWLAVLAASHRYPADVVVIVDCGSAITVDVVAEGCHLGGYIAPGLRLMMSALYRNTSQVKVAAMSAEELSLGCNTDDAVSSGVLSMAVGLVERVCRDEALASGSLSLVVTGGDGGELVRHLDVSCPVYRCDDLVLEGLQWAKFESLS